MGNRINVNKPKIITNKQSPNDNKYKQRISPKPQNSPPHPHPQQKNNQRRHSDIQNVISTVNNAKSTV